MPTSKHRKKHSLKKKQWKQDQELKKHQAKKKHREFVQQIMDERSARQEVAEQGAADVRKHAARQDGMQKAMRNQSTSLVDAVNADVDMSKLNSSAESLPTLFEAVPSEFREDLKESKAFEHADMLVEDHITDDAQSHWPGMQKNIKEIFNLGLMNVGLNVFRGKATFPIIK